MPPELEACLQSATLHRFAQGSKAEDGILSVLTALENCGVLTPGQKETARARLIEREASLSTALGGGVALPHGFDPDFNQPRLAVGLFKRGLEWESPDQRPVHVMFLILFPQTKEARDLHLRLLGRLAAITLSKGSLEALLAAETDFEAARTWSGLIDASAR